MAIRNSVQPYDPQNAVTYEQPGSAAAYQQPPTAIPQWVPKPMPVQGVPPGLEYLLNLDKLIVQQQINYIEAFAGMLSALMAMLLGWEQNNKYLIKNATGQNIFFAAEQTSTCMRLCCGENRGFVIHIVDYTNQECLRITRKFKCCAGCCWCAGCCNGCAFEVTVETPAGEVMGYVRQKGSCWRANYHILDASHNTVMKIQGPCCICDGPCCPCDNRFELTSPDGISRGRVAKKYAGFAKELFTLADNFMIEFPQDLSVSTKATLLGALFLIDFMFFEHKDDGGGGGD